MDLSLSAPAEGVDTGTGAVDKDDVDRDNGAFHLFDDAVEVNMSPQSPQESAAPDPRPLVSAAGANCIAAEEPAHAPNHGSAAGALIADHEQQAADLEAAAAADAGAGVAMGQEAAGAGDVDERAVSVANYDQVNKGELNPAPEEPNAAAKQLELGEQPQLASWRLWSSLTHVRAPRTHIHKPL